MNGGLMRRLLPSLDRSSNNSGKADVVRVPNPKIRDDDDKSMRTSIKLPIAFLKYVIRLKKFDDEPSVPVLDPLKKCDYRIKILVTGKYEFCLMVLRPSVFMFLVPQLLTESIVDKEFRSQYFNHIVDCLRSNTLHSTRLEKIVEKQSIEIKGVKGDFLFSKLR